MIKSSHHNARDTVMRELRTASAKKLSEEFRFNWLVLGGPPLIAEHHFDHTRRWRFDFAIPEKKIAIEIEGLTHQGGRHQRLSGYSLDCEKYNAALLLGWKVLRLTRKQVKDPRALEQYIKYIDAMGVGG